MAAELIDHYIDPEGIRRDTDFIIKEFRKAQEALDSLNKTKFELSGATSFKGAGEAIKKLERDIAELRSANEALTVAMERQKSAAKEQTKETVAQRIEVSKRNAETKRAVELEQASANSIDEARAKVKSLTAERNKLNLATEEGRKQNTLLNAEIDKQNTFIRENVDAYQKQKINIGNYEGSAKIIVSALNDVEKKLESLREKQTSLQNLSNTNPVGFQIGGGASELNQVTLEIKNAEKEFLALNDITSNPKFLNIAAKAGDARTEIRGFTTSLIQLEQQGFGNSQSANDLRKRLAELTDQVADAKQEIKALSSDTRGFDLAASGFRSLTSSVQAYVGIAELAGENQEDLQRSIQRLAAVENIANGAREIANDLTTRGSLANKGYAFFQGLVATTTDASAAATTRLGAALKLVGIGLLVGAIAFLVIKYNEMAKATTDAASKRKLLSDVEAAAADSYGQEKAQLDSLISSLKQEGLSRKAKMDIIEELQSKYPGYFDNIKNETDLNDKLSIAYAKASEGILLKARAQAAADLLSQNETKRITARIDLEKENEEISKTQQRVIVNTGGKFASEAAIDAKRKRAEAKAEFDKTINELDNQNKTLLETINTSNSGIDKLGGKLTGGGSNKDEDAAKKAEEARKKAKADEQKAAFELLKFRKELAIREQKEIAESDSFGLQQRVTARLKQADLEADLIASKQAFELAQEGVTESGRLKIKEEGAAAIKALEQQSASDIISIRQSVKDKEAQDIADTLAATGAQSDAIEAGKVSAIEKGLEAKLSAIEFNAEQENALNLANFSKGTISKEQYEAQKVAIENKARRESLLAEIEQQEKLVKIAMPGTEAEKAALQKLADLRKKLNADGLKDKEDTIAKDLAMEQKKNEKLKELANEVKETVFAFLTAGIENEKNKTQEQIDLLEIKKQKDIEVANQSIASTTERAAAIQIIEARAAAQREQLEKRKRQLDQERAKFERAKNIADIIQSTATAVVSALGSKPFTPANIALAAIVGAIGAAQIARTLATPIPKYAKGRKGGPEEFAIVGDGGKREVIEYPTGEKYITPDTPTLTYLPKNAIVHPSADALMNMGKRATDRTLANAHLLKQPNDAYQFQNMTNKLSKDLKEVTRAVKNIPQTNVIVQSKLKQWVRSNGSETNYL